MIEVRDYGFATFLFLKEYNFKVDENSLIIFNIKPEVFDRELVLYRSSDYFIFDIKARELKKKIKTLKSKNLI